MRKVAWKRFQYIVLASVISVAPLVSSLSVNAQEEESEVEQSVLVESTFVGDVDPSTAVTVSDLTIPIDQLQLLVKPLTLEELQTEAAAWLLLLKDKVQEITTVEIAIKREEQVIESEREAEKAVEAAQASLAEAEAALAEASPGTPEYERAAQQLEDAKQDLQASIQAVEEAVETEEELQQDEDLQEALEEAKSEGDIDTARQVLKDAIKDRESLTPGSNSYDAATEKIDVLEEALVDLESAEADLEAAIPESSEYQDLSKVVEQARADAIKAAEAISGADIEEDGESDDADAAAALEDIEDISDSVEADEDDADAGDADEISASEGDADEGDTDEISASEDNADGGDADQGDAEADETDTAERLEEVAEQFEESTDSDIRSQLLVQATELQSEQSAIIERFNVVLDSLERKGGDVTSYRAYIDAISGIELDITDTQGLGIRLIGWITAPEGGIRLGIGILKFGGILLIAVFLSPRLGRLADTLLSRVEAISTLFRGFAVMVVKRGVLVLGALFAIASLGVSLGPLLALVGGVSFVLAFALQSNLGNFASGLMLLVSKPFDVGDEVRIAGYWSYVHSISLANTKLKDFSGNLITLPNNTVWGGDIINFTHAEVRKFMIYLYVKFSQDIDEVYEMWAEIASSHPEILKDPGPGWFPWNSHYEYYICVGLSAWGKTDDYWTVYLDLLRQVQKRVNELGIELAAPAQDIRLNQGLPSEVVDQLLPPSKA